MERAAATDVCFLMANAASAKLGQNLQNIVAQTVDLAKLLEENPPADSELYAVLQGIAATDTDILEVGLAYVAGMAPGESGLFAPHYGKRDGLYQNFRVDSYYDYSTSDWFLDGLRHGAHWFRPYFGHATQSWVVGYVVPIRSPGAHAGEYPAGVVRINYSMHGIESLVSALPLGQSGAAFIVSREGILIHHSDVGHIERKETMAHLVPELGAGTVTTLTEDVRIFERTAHMYHNPIRDVVSIIIQQPIPSTNWALVCIFDVDEVAQSGTKGLYLTLFGTIFRASVLLAVCALLYFLAPWGWMVLKEASALWQRTHPR